MIYIIIGCFAFVFLYVFDFNKIFFFNKNLSICFAVGILLIVFSTLEILFRSYDRIKVPISQQWFYIAMSIISLLLIIYSLFFALPFVRTYVSVQKGNTVVDKGIYALCRHPGVIWFFFFYLFLWLASGKMMMMWAGIIWTSMDIIHVYVQDRWLLPKALKGYDQYKAKVPFLIPNMASIKNCFSI